MYMYAPVVAPFNSRPRCNPLQPPSHRYAGYIAYINEAEVLGSILTTSN